MKITGYRTYLAGLVAITIPFLEWVTNNEFFIYTEDFTKSVQVAAGVCVFLFRYLSSPKSIDKLLDKPKGE